MDCWSVLQLQDDAERRDIKRNYARLLKTFRPDEDPEGFQRLRDAYERALQIAQWRLENEEEQADSDVPVAAPVGFSTLFAEAPDAAANQPLTETAPWDFGSLQVEPVKPAAPEPFAAQPAMQVEPVRPAADEQTTDPSGEAAWRLLDGLSDENLGERWEQAQQQDCAAAFEKLLLQLCFEQPPLRRSIAAWTVQHLGWLGPWQELVMSASQRETLANELLADYRQSLQALLEAQNERDFLQLLKTYTAQPWLQVFDRREQWQQLVLQLLHDTEWSVPLFERIAQLFGWDDTKGIHPQPDWLWQALIERCNRESFYDNLHAKAEDAGGKTPDVLAAQMLINPMKPGQHKRMTDTFITADWVACQQLSDTLKWRFPELLARLPYADIYYWRRFLPRYVAAETWLRTWAALALVMALFHLGNEQKSVILNIIVPITMAGVLVWFFRITMSWWVLLSAQVIVQDLWITENLIPPRWNPDTRWLVVRHGVPQAAMVLPFSTFFGGLGAAAYVGVVLIGLVHKRRIGSLDTDFGNRHPLLTALHWAHFSPLQLLFLLAMTCVIAASQLGYSLKHLLPG